MSFCSDLYPDEIHFINPSGTGTNLVAFAATIVIGVTLNRFECINIFVDDYARMSPII
jgi:hypothetical protein